MLKKRIIACLDVADGRVVKGVRFRDHEDVGDLHETSFVCLHRVTPTRVHHNNSGVCLASNFNFHLANANGLYQNPRAPNCVKQMNCFTRCQ